jgi:hypothetical protein
LCCVCCTVRIKGKNQDNQDKEVVQMKYREQRNPAGGGGGGGFFFYVVSKYKMGKFRTKNTNKRVRM